MLNRNFTAVFDGRTSFCAKGWRRTLQNRNFTAVLADRTSFRAKGLRPTLENRNFTAVFADRTSFRTKGLFRIAILLQFLTIEPHFVPDASKSQFYYSF